MAYAKLNFELVFFFLFHLPVLPSIFVASPLKENQHRCAFDAIFQLGDSTSDTDNLIQEDPSSSCIRFPYGETFFKKPTGRCSDELLIIDYITRSAGVPFLDAYLTPNVTFSHGANFAVSGSTALPVSVLAEKKIIAPITNSSLSVQLDWMFSYFKGRCRNGEGQ
ncbi:acetylajmalan esterase-like [Jatropha curcas]|uniref:acetylajmalan esterase-like n=1 Tax=Jatropha curcas TaxID=180498 RepID=UPI001895D3B3|nr:acetylajmalan esterase-like [Jatropha curcas]